jgi:hypothetical protein
MLTERSAGQTAGFEHGGDWDAEADPQGTSPYLQCYVTQVL